jgi:hypothetical protein
MSETGFRTIVLGVLRACVWHVLWIVFALQWQCHPHIFHLSAIAIHASVKCLHFLCSKKYLHFVGQEDAHVHQTGRLYKANRTRTWSRNHTPLTPVSPFRTGACYVPTRYTHYRHRFHYGSWVQGYRNGGFRGRTGEDRRKTSSGKSCSIPIQLQQRILIPLTNRHAGPVFGRSPSPMKPIRMAQSSFTWPLSFSSFDVS